ncbi:three-helix bundle dimerization domain-containing protein [Mycobacterium sp. smrl_JER01]|uniref:three-helix bundle dimerization domain-containing protein n=1 Tax=Mycobacterium sp. smrl_JER01 TaxID=3402633 RepID=UPI003AD42128
MIALSEQQIIDQLALRLADAHARLEPARVAEIVQEQYARFEGRPIRDFVPLFVERNATAELIQLGG